MGEGGETGLGAERKIPDLRRAEWGSDGQRDARKVIKQRQAAMGE